ncbi:NAD(P)-binding domain-containing protein [Acidisoma cellulosilyticum]|uniref:NAD(P)-binding domain-containing protein n=1 Tax=Acidisoma cellulosilyticum TaxID=2802395 RepID=UPI001D0BB558|nr:NAD(P)/FAD-dependent oxidoreductase [Acidisoma cellulosilyticum]
MSLTELNARVRADLACLDYPAKPWLQPQSLDGQPVLDVLIIGAGQGGLATAFGLMREKITNILVVDQAPRGEEGVWTTFARMVTLRTPKHVSGPDLGVGSLTPRAWYEASFGHARWEGLGKIPREVWQAYLDWYRQVLNLPVRNDTGIVGIAEQGPFLAATTDKGELLLARKIVLATGIAGSGAWLIPDFIENNLPRARYGHTSEPIDFAALAGKRVGVLGAGASAFDNAATALEAGAGRVQLCVRRRRLPRVNPYRWMEQAGFLSQFAELPDLMRWRFMRHIFTMNQPPPPDTVARCAAFPQFSAHPGTPWLDARMEGDEIRIAVPGGELAFDFVIIGAGFVIDASRRPELAHFAPMIATWADHFAPPEGEEDPVLASYPYLTRSFAFTERTPGQVPALAHLYNFTFGAMPSMGLSGASISGLKFGVRRLVNAICRDFFLEDAEASYLSLLDYQEPELTPDSWPDGGVGPGLAPLTAAD